MCRYLLLAVAIMASIIALAAAGNAAPPATPPATPPQPAAKPFRVLVFSRTAGFRHDSIPDGIAAIKQLGQDNGFDVDATEDPTTFTDDKLAPYTEVIFLSTTGDILDTQQQAAFERYIAKGRGYVGIHAAADTEYDWPWYGQLVGAYFKSHPEIQEATIIVKDRTHPSTAHLPERWKRTDEWYTYRDNPRERVHVLAVVDESTYKGGGMGADHPISWCHEFGGGRAWYTGLGHTKESYSEPEFLQHVLGGIKWAAGVAPAPAAKDATQGKTPQPAPAKPTSK